MLEYTTQDSSVSLLVITVGPGGHLPEGYIFLSSRRLEDKTVIVVASSNDRHLRLITRAEFDQSVFQDEMTAIFIDADIMTDRISCKVAIQHYDVDHKMIGENHITGDLTTSVKHVICYVPPVPSTVVPPACSTIVPAALSSGVPPARSSIVQTLKLPGVPPIDPVIPLDKAQVLSIENIVTLDNCEVKINGVTVSRNATGPQTFQVETTTITTQRGHIRITK